MVKMWQLRLLGLVTKEILVLLALQDRQVPLVPQAPLVLPDRPVPPGLMVAMGLMVVQDQLVQPVLPVLPVPQGPLLASVHHLLPQAPLE